MAENGVIMPTTQGVRYMPGSFQMASFNVMFFDTTDIVEKRSLFRKLLDNNAYNPQKLFEGIKHDKNNEYKVDFGIYNIHRPENRAFVNGYERTILLDFNVDGDILDMM